jgi:hypothetical protein
LAGTRRAHFNCENREQTSQQSLEVFEKTNSKLKKPRLMKNLSEEAATYQLLVPHVGEHREEPRQRPCIGRLPDRLRHAMLNLVQRREDRCSNNPCPGGSVSRHLAKTEWLSLKRHNPPPPGVVLADDGPQGDPSSSEASQHHPVLHEHFLLLRLRRTMGPVRPRLPDGVPSER